MGRKWTLYILLITLGIFLVSTSYSYTFSKNEIPETEQSDNQSADTDEQENKRSFDDEVILHVYAMSTPLIFRIATLRRLSAKALPNISLSLHCPPPEFA